MQNKIHANINMNQAENKKVHSLTQSMGQGSSDMSGTTAGVALKANTAAIRTLKEMKNQKVQSYEEAFTKIMSATGISDLSQLTRTFIQAEEKNFALFKFVNELNSEIENFETQIFEMQCEIDRNVAEGGEDSQKRKAIKEMEKTLTKTNEQIAEMERDQRTNQSKIVKVKECISKISQVVECDDSENQELLGHQGITESNMFVYMGLVEARINEILQAYVYIQAKKNKPLYDELQGDLSNEGRKQAASSEQEILAKQQQIMRPGIFNPVQIEQDSSDDEAFGRKKKAASHKKQISDLADGISQSFHTKVAAAGDSDSDDDDADLFSVPMNSDAFMAKIAQQQSGMFR